jgi:hypothetical protein
MRLARVTVTLPAGIVAQMDRSAANRSRFVLEAVTRELARRRRAALQASLSAPHPESLPVAETGVGKWGRSLPLEGFEELLDPSRGRGLLWIEGKGWKGG